MKSNLFLFFTLLLFAVGCTDDEEIHPVDPVDAGGEIGLSESVVTFATGYSDTVSIDVEGTCWWVDNIVVEDTTAVVGQADKDAMAEGEDFSTVCRWLTVSRTGGRLELAVEDNFVIDERLFSVTLASEGDTVTIEGKQNGVPTGYWGDIIGLEPTSVTFTAEGGTAECSTDKANWEVIQIKVDGETTTSTLDERNEQHRTGKFEKTIGWLTVKADGVKLYVTTAPNDKGRERKFEVVLESGDCFNRLYGTQAAE